METTNMGGFQRIGTISNAHVGRDFENKAQEYFSALGISLSKGLTIPIGTGTIKKPHAFDLGCQERKILVECKSHKWTSPGDNIPSAKVTVWNEAMFYFYLAPSNFRKVFFVLGDFSKKRGETLGEYYIRNHQNLIPLDVEVLEFDEKDNSCRSLK